MTIRAYGARAADLPLEPMEIERREPGPTDVEIAISYCGICHSDLHTVRGEWSGTRYPCVPGHEIVGKVTRTGDRVTKFKPNDTVGVGCMVDSCRTCPSCEQGLEQYCDNGFIGTYNGKTDDPPGHTLGGYAEKIVVDQDFVLRITHKEDRLAEVAPLLCAAITTWSPLRHWRAGPGKKVGIVGIGGLGHMGIKLAKALGAHTVGFTTSEHKRGDITKLGADEVIVSKNRAEMAEHTNSFDLIVNTVAASHDLDHYLKLLKCDGTMVLVGLPDHPHPTPNIAQLIHKRRAIAGSLIGGIQETQEMLDFCAAHDITADIELVKPEEIDAAYDRMLKSDVKYRFVIDQSGN